MEPTGSDREVMRFATFVLALVAVIVASVALVVAIAADHTDSQKVPIQQTEAAPAGAQHSSLDVTLEEYKIVTNLDQVKAGPVDFTMHNVGTMKHEVVLVRAPSVDALPRVTVAGGERAVGAVDEEAVPEADKPGEAEVPKGKTVTKTIKLTPGTYVMICNIDTKLADGTLLNHLVSGMYQMLVVT